MNKIEQKCQYNNCQINSFAITTYGNYCYEHWIMLKSHYDKDEYKEMYNKCKMCKDFIDKPEKICSRCSENMRYNYV